MKVQVAHFVAALCLAGLTVSATPIPENCLTGGFAIGCQAWTFNHFSVMEAIDKTAEAGGKVIEFYPGQKFSPEQSGLEIRPQRHRRNDRRSPGAVEQGRHSRRQLRRGRHSQGRSRGAERFSISPKSSIFTASPPNPVDSIDTIEKLVKEYDIRVGFHDHQRQPNNPATKCGIRITF